LKPALTDSSRATEDRIWSMLDFVFCRTPPWARDARRPCRASLALFKRSAPTWTLGRVGLQSAPTDPSGRLSEGARIVGWLPVSRTRKYSPRRVGLPDTILLGRDKLQVEVACNLPQRQPAGAVLSHHPDRGLLGAVLHELVVPAFKPPFDIIHRMAQEARRFPQDTKEQAPADPANACPILLPLLDELRTFCFEHSLEEIPALLTV
jgi:hypothetical protein